MKILVVGTGYVGLVSGSCFAEIGADVCCLDVNAEKIALLNSGVMTIYEEGLDELVSRNVKAGRLRFSTDMEREVRNADIIFSAVGTPQGEDGQADLKYVYQVAESVGTYMDRYILFVNKSTVPVGTAARVRNIIQEQLDRRGLDLEFDVASNPEFLKEGNAIEDFMRPDRVVIGVDSERAEKLLSSLYRPMQLNNFRVLFMDIASAEMTKYASNAMLATRISFMNEIANLCEKVGADVDMVRQGIGSDHRIGNKFLYSGAGYGGSCFPKDVRALITTARAHDSRLRLLEAVEEVNLHQKDVIYDKIRKRFGELKGITVAMWGLSFKPGTDDIREAPSLHIIDRLLADGCRVRVYDPVAMDIVRGIYSDRIYFARDKYEAVKGADALVHITEWKEFRLADWDIVRMAMRTPALFDGRNVFRKEDLPGFEFYRIGKIG